MVIVDYGIYFSLTLRLGTYVKSTVNKAYFGFGIYYKI